MKLAKLFLEFKQGSVYKVLVKLENAYVRTYLRILWTSLANMTISLDLSMAILKDAYKTGEPILIKVKNDLSNFFISRQNESIAEFSQKSVSKGFTIRDLLNKQLDVPLNSLDSISFRGKGDVFAINANEEKRLVLGISNLYVEESLELLRTFLTQQKREFMQKLASL